MSQASSDATGRLVAPPTWPPVIPAEASRLIATKYRVPTLREGVAGRARLLEDLDRALSHPLTLVSAPPGFGKSTLLASWAADRGTPVAWLSLDAEDADVTRFLEYLLTALHHRIPGIAESARQLLHSSVPPPISATLAALVNDLLECGESLVVVLDDYHQIDTPEAHQVVAFLVEHLPPGVHLAIATRADPPLPLARWRVRGQLAEVRAADLRFTPSEAAALLGSAAGIELEDGVVRLLHERTEGWAAGLQLAGLSLRGSDNPGNLARGVAGGEDLVLDYLTEEVLHRLPSATVDFLLRTSILDRLCGSLCDRVTGGTGGSEVLGALERQNLFVEALDDDRLWYRYHRLFADLLRHRLHREHPGLEETLHRRASTWFEENGATADAVRHAVAAGDGDEAARIVEAAAEMSLAVGEFTTVARWAEALPGEALRARPVLSAFVAMAFFYSGYAMEQVRTALAPAEGDSAGEVAKGAVAALQAVMAALRGSVGEARQFAAHALDILPPDREFLRSLARTTAGLASLRDGDLDVAESSFAEVLEVARVSDNLVLQVLATRRLAGIAVLRGDLRLAESRYRRILDLTVGADGRQSPLSALARIGLGGLHREWNDLAEAEAQTREGLESARRLGQPFALDGLIALCRVLQARGDLDGAVAAIEEAGRVAAQFDATSDDDAYVAAVEAGVHLAEGDVDGATRWAERRGLLTETGTAAIPSLYPGEAEWTTAARLFLRTGQPERTLSLVGPLLVRAEAQGRGGSVIELETLQALALDMKGEERLAMTALVRALTRGAPHGHLRTFLDEGEPLERLLRRTVAEGMAPPFARTVLAALVRGVSRIMTGATLAEPLTPAERRVLRHLASPLSVPDIARELYLAPSTVRSHVKALYRKLGVSRRSEAVARARSVGLL